MKSFYFQNNTSLASQPTTRPLLVLLSARTLCPSPRSKRLRVVCVVWVGCQVRKELKVPKEIQWEGRGWTASGSLKAEDVRHPPTPHSTPRALPAAGIRGAGSDPRAVAVLLRRWSVGASSWIASSTW